MNLCSDLYNKGEGRGERGEKKEEKKKKEEEHKKGKIFLMKSSFVKSHKDLALEAFHPRKTQSSRAAGLYEPLS
jgi:hypothetical protein